MLVINLSQLKVPQRGRSSKAKEKDGADKEGGGISVGLLDVQ